MNKGYYVLLDGLVIADRAFCEDNLFNFQKTSYLQVLGEMVQVFIEEKS
jgi:hypothetical protein